MAALVDTNVLVHRFDARFPEKQRRATEVLHRGIAEDSIRLPHQALVEFVVAVTRPTSEGAPLLPPEDARREAEEMLSQFEVLYPTEALVRTALRGGAPTSSPGSTPTWGLRRALRARRAPLGGFPARPPLRDGPGRESVPLRPAASSGPACRRAPRCHVVHLAGGDAWGRTSCRGWRGLPPMS